MNLKNKIIAMDMDGTLCKEVCWTPEEALRATPNKDVVRLCDELHRNNFVVIYTARRDELIPATLEWLRLNHVHFQAISNRKMPADVYYDDKAFNPVESKVGKENK